MSLKDIAKEVGVSVSTVSRVLNTEGTSAASKELQARIWDTARRQGYVPNATARALKWAADPRPPEVRPLYCMYACPPQETKDDLFYTLLAGIIEREAFKNNYLLHYTFSAVDLDSPNLQQTFRATPSDALVMLGRFESDLLRRVRRNFKKVIYIGLNELDVHCDQVICNGFDIARSSVEYFYGLNHRRIGYVGCHEGRYAGYCAALQALGLPYDPRYVVDDAVLSMEGGYQAMLRLLDRTREVTAVFCGNDMVAIGALRACKDRGLRIPQDISLMGVNDIENVQYTSPMLSSVHVPLDEMGKMAFHILQDRINGGHSSCVKVEFPFSIVRRESIARLPGPEE